MSHQSWLSKITARATGRQVFPTRFGEAAVYMMPDENGALVRVLNVGGVLQSATYLDERWAECPFAYLRSFDHMFEAQPALPIGNVLMIGGAGFAYPKQLLVSHPGVKLDVVEIDPAIVALAREFFFLDRLEHLLEVEGRAEDFRIITEDGEDFLRKRAALADNAPYDAIVVDAFTGRAPVPFFASDEGIFMAKKCLVPNGLLVTNCVAEYSTDAMYRLFSQVERLREHFTQVSVIDASDEEFGGADNYLLIATDGAYEFSDVIPYGE